LPCSANAAFESAERTAAAAMAAEVAGVVTRFISSPELKGLMTHEYRPG
jgi:hypothetical protein